jgi:hypothetical protein
MHEFSRLLIQALRSSPLYYLLDWSGGAMSSMASGISSFYYGLSFAPSKDIYQDLRAMRYFKRYIYCYLSSLSV